MIPEINPKNILLESGQRVIDSISGSKICFDDLDSAIINFESNIFQKTSQLETYSDELLDMFSADQLQMLRQAYCYWETAIEARFASDASISSFDNYRLCSRFDRLVLKEIDLLEGFQPKSILFIDSGPLPISAIHYSRYLKCKITCLDKDASAVEQSKHTLERCYREKIIDIHQGWGEEIDCSQYDLIVIALLAMPKEKILNNILKTLSGTTRVICRTSEGLRRLLYQPLNAQDITGFNLENCQHAQNEDTISSLLLVKSIG